MNIWKIEVKIDEREGVLEDNNGIKEKTRKERFKQNFKEYSKKIG